VDKFIENRKYEASRNTHLVAFVLYMADGHYEANRCFSLAIEAENYVRRAEWAQ
jgi:hypothetical protein